MRFILRTQRHVIYVRLDVYCHTFVRTLTPPPRKGVRDTPEQGPAPHRARRIAQRALQALAELPMT